MPIVHHVKKSRKAYKRAGKVLIKKGQEYWWWTTRRTVGKKWVKTIHRSSTKPRQSQLVSSPFQRTILGIQEDLETLSGSAQEVQASIEYAITEIESLKDETDTALENIPEALRESPTGELLQQRIDGLEGWASSLQEVIDGIENEFDEEEMEIAYDHSPALDALKAAAIGAFQGID